MNLEESSFKQISQYLTDAKKEKDYFSDRFKYYIKAAVILYSISKNNNMAISEIISNNINFDYVNIIILDDIMFAVDGVIC